MDKKNIIFPEMMNGKLSKHVFEIIEVISSLTLIMGCKTNYQSKVESTCSAVCKIRINSESYGTGFLVDEDLVLTNYHLFNNNNSINHISLLFYYETASINATIFKFDSEKDLALLKIEKTKNIKPIIISSKSYDIGDTVFNIANQNNISLCFCSGVLSNPEIEIFDNGIASKYIESNIDIYPGCSGSPLLNSDFECIGITTLRLKDLNFNPISSFSYSIPSSEIKEFLK